MSRSPETTSKIMRSVKSKDTKPEKTLAKAMWANGLRYRKQYKVIGKPDFAFIKLKVAVFCDGDFWHGNAWKLRKKESFEAELVSYDDFWREKILKNVERDKRVKEELEKLGWNVVRIWESDIKANPNECVERVKKALGQR